MQNKVKQCPDRIRSDSVLIHDLTSTDSDSDKDMLYCSALHRKVFIFLLFLNDNIIVIFQVQVVLHSSAEKGVHSWMININSDVYQLKFCSSIEVMFMCIYNGYVSTVSSNINVTSIKTEITEKNNKRTQFPDRKRQTAEIAGVALLPSFVAIFSNLLFFSCQIHTQKNSRHIFS